jgi:hypothetical protein
VIEALHEVFGASRRAVAPPWEHRFMPPVVMTESSYHVVMGQRKWRVQGGFPQQSFCGVFTCRAHGLPMPIPVAEVGGKALGTCVHKAKTLRL